MLTTFRQPIVCHFGPYSRVQYQRKNDLRPREKNTKKEPNILNDGLSNSWLEFIIFSALN